MHVRFCVQIDQISSRNESSIANPFTGLGAARTLHLFPQIKTTASVTPTIL
jgi:hypothetical protein